MNIRVTGRHINMSDRLKEYATIKLEKLETYFNQLIDAHVVLYIEKLDHISEVIINGDGVQFHGREKAENLYSSIDQLFEKMEKQIVRYKEKHSMHKGPARGEINFFDVIGAEGHSIRLSQVSNKPIDKVEAYLQMKVDDKDFILFKKGIGSVDSDMDYLNKNYAVIYKINGTVKMTEIPFDKIRDHKFDEDHFVEYDLEVIDDSPVQPNIAFNKKHDCEIKKLSVDEAIKEIENNNTIDFLPFFNIESQYFNVIYKSGSMYEIAVPAF